MKLTLAEQVKAAIAVSTPLIGIQTPDPASTFQSVCRIIPAGSPVIQWDIATGFRPMNDLGKRVLAAALPQDSAASDFTNLADALVISLKFPKESVLFVYNLQNLIADPTGNSVMNIQALWNLRDPYKTLAKTLIAFGPELRFPPELAQDFLVFDEPLPNDAQREQIIKEQIEAAIDQFENFQAPDADTIRRAVDVTRGMTAFMVEQQTAICLVGKKLDIEQLAERMRRTINQVQGLSVHTGGERFTNLGGLTNAKTYFGSLFGNVPFGTVVFIDEIEKHFGGVLGDLSGVSQENLGAMLSWMQDNNITGSILIGPGGSGKSALGKALGNEAGIPTINFDLSATKGSLVGESGRNLRTAFKTINAIAGDKRIFVVATCNSIAILPPELRRRFTHGIFFVDLPTAEEREAIWKIYLKPSPNTKEHAAWNEMLTKAKGKPARPNDEGWTGAEIKACVQIAQDNRWDLETAARYVIPISISAKQQIDKLRDDAKGKFVSASASGFYGEEAEVLELATASSKRTFRS